MKPLFTSSRLDAIFRCSGAATLPHIEEVERNDSTALAGTREHAEVLGPALPENLYQWLSEAGEPVFEQPFLMDFSDVAQPQAEAVTQPARHKTADRYIEVLRATTGAGTPDAYAITVNEQRIKLRVGDLKTGAGQAAGLLPSPERSWQLLSYVLAVLAQHNWPASGAQITDCQVAFFTRDYEAEYSAQPDSDPQDRDHLWRITSASLDEQQLLQALESLNELTHRLTRNLPVWREGAWCSRCTAFRACPVQKSPVQRLGIALDAAETTLTEQDAAQVATALPAVRTLLEQAEKFLDRWCATRDLPLADAGTVLRREKRTRQVFTPEAPALLKKLLPGLAPMMLRESVSVGRIAEALGESAPGPLTAELLAHLKRSGVMEEMSSFFLRNKKSNE